MQESIGLRSERSKGTVELLAVSHLKSKLRELRRPVTSSNVGALNSQINRTLRERRCSVSCNWHWLLAKNATDTVDSRNKDGRNVDAQGQGCHSETRLSFIYGGYGDDNGTWTRNLRQYQNQDANKNEILEGAHRRNPLSDADLLYTRAIKARLQMNSTRR